MRLAPGSRPAKPRLLPGTLVALLYPGPQGHRDQRPVQNAFAPPCH